MDVTIKHYLRLKKNGEYDFIEFYKGNWYFFGNDCPFDEEEVKNSSVAFYLIKKVTDENGNIFEI